MGEENMEYEEIGTEKVDLNFEYGKEFDGEYPPEAAEWCNNNRAYIEELTAAPNGTRRFKIVAIPDPTFDEVKAEATARVNADTSRAIFEGFDHEIDTGNGKEVLHFSYDSFDQINFNQTVNIATLALSGGEGLPESVMWNGYRNYTPENGGELVRIALTPTAFLDLYVKGASAHKALQMELGGQKKAQIESCETVEEINSLMTEWGL
jgi:hypothetical protein